MQSLSIRVSLEDNVKACEGNVYSHRFLDIAVPRLVDIIAGLQGAKGLINVLLVRLLPHSEKHGTLLH